MVQETRKYLKLTGAGVEPCVPVRPPTWNPTVRNQRHGLVAIASPALSGSLEVFGVAEGLAGSALWWQAELALDEDVEHL